MGLIESLAEDVAALDKLKLNSNEGDENAKGDTQTGDGDGSGTSVRSRLSARRGSRDTGTSSQDEGGVPQKDDATSRKGSGDSRGHSGGTRKNASSSQGDDGTPQGGEGDGGDVDPNVEPEPKTAADWVKHRQNLRDIQAQKTKLEREIAELRKGGSTTPPAADTAKKIDLAPVEEPKLRDVKELGAEPDKTKDLASWLLWDAERKQIILDNLQAVHTKSERQAQLNEAVKSAVAYTDNILSNYKKVNPDFENAYKFGREAYKDAMKRVYANASDATIENRIKWEELQLAIKCENEGTSLGDVLYDMAISRFGYDPDNAPSTRQSTRTGDNNGTNGGYRPNLRTIANNKRRSASPLEGGGQSGRSTVSLEAASKMSIEELQNLNKQDWEYLRSQGF